MSYKCTKCWENDVKACHVSLGEQQYYKGFKIYDQIMIVRGDSDIGVESDVEVKYKTKHPCGERRPVREPSLRRSTAGKRRRCGNT